MYYTSKKLKKEFYKHLLMLAKEAYPFLGVGGILVKQCLDLNYINFINNFLYKKYALVYILVHSMCINFTMMIKYYAYFCSLFTM